ncbi:hypothetical protein B0H34DRAFT_182472 [Crassisporium funariophilum]|nr:hypothetical protein B0H34DRAFT_182472 [Crassisporium funariophilum]
MASMFNQVFSCCLQRKRSKTFDTPNEQSHLIPATAEESPSSSSPNAFVIDQQKLKERMGSIVRSKEGCVATFSVIYRYSVFHLLRKMVNVNSRLPFNLHNKKLSVTIDPSSSSRSASSSTHPRPSLNFSPLPSTTPSNGQVQAHVGAPLTTAVHPTVSRSSSMASRETSAHESDPSTTRTPILNIRLVRGLPSGGAGITARRGRAKRKAGESNVSAGAVYPEHIRPLDEPSSPGSTVDDGTPRIHTLLPISTDANTGPLTVSWGD